MKKIIFITIVLTVTFLIGVILGTHNEWLFKKNVTFILNNHSDQKVPHVWIYCRYEGGGEKHAFIENIQPDTEQQVKFYIWGNGMGCNASYSRAQDEHEASKKVFGNSYLVPGETISIDLNNLEI